MSHFELRYDTRCIIENPISKIDYEITTHEALSLDKKRDYEDKKIFELVSGVAERLQIILNKIINDAEVRSYTGRTGLDFVKITLIPEGYDYKAGIFYFEKLCSKDDCEKVLEIIRDYFPRNTVKDNQEPFRNRLLLKLTM